MSTLSQVITVPLQERIAVDEVEALAAVAAEVSGDQVDAVLLATNSSVQLEDGESVSRSLEQRRS